MDDLFCGEGGQGWDSGPELLPVSYQKNTWLHFEKPDMWVAFKRGRRRRGEM